jgi:predicted ATPase
LLRAEVLWDTVEDADEFPFSLPAVRGVDRLSLDGSRNLRYSQRATESNLADHLRLVWQWRHRTAFFLRAETFFNTASAYDDVDDKLGGYHGRSHGEQFIDVALRQFRPGGLYLMDEPESALSIHGELRLLRRMHDLVPDSQFIVATHSPVLLAYPGAVIYSFDAGAVTRVRYEDTEAYQLTKSFLDAPERFFRHLLADE